MGNGTMKSSGEERTFASGAVRDGAKGKPRPDLISPHANLREGEWLRKGCEDRDPPYPERNWERGLPISQCIASLERHLLAYKLGLQDEDHMAAIRTNAGFILHYEEEIAAGRMDPAIDDMPRYAALQPEIVFSADHTRAAKEIAFGFALYSGRADDGMFEGEHVGLTGSIDCANEWLATGELGDAKRVNFKATQSPEPKCLPAPSLESQSALRAWDVACPPAPPERTVYIAGPMRGYTHFNFPAFDGARDLGKSLGWKVISPADLDRAEGLDPFNDPAKINEVNLSTEGLRDTAHRDLNALLSLKAGNGDAIAMRPGRGSHGTGGLRPRPAIPPRGRPL